MNDKKQKDSLDRLINSYDTMMEHVHDLLVRGEKQAAPLKDAVADAREKMVTLGQLTKDEAEKVSSYLERDMKEAAGFIHETGQDFKEWFRFDVELIEKRFLDMFVSVADQTSVQLREFADRARESSQYHTGEITGPGTLVCTACEKEMHFKKTGHIPPCSACKGTVFKRSKES